MNPDETVWRTPPANPYRLSRNVLPVKYDLELFPNLDNFTFEGLIKIDLKATEPTDKITVHALDLNISEAWLLGSGSRTKAKNIEFNKELETVTFEFDGLTDKQRSTIVISFSGELNDKMHGFYRMHDSEKNVIGAATQFEATDARRCFPCFDEPDMKAGFVVRMKVPSHMTALSNMPIVSEALVDDNKAKYVVFQPTPKMSTYLLAFVVADLEYIEGRDRKGIPIRVYTTPGKKEWGRFALDFAVKALPEFGKWYGVDYFAPKLDLIALSDFAAGAMENPGLITFRETALLINPNEISTAAMESVAGTVSHESAHMQFGDFVTMKWWDDLWLNEGFATFAGTKMVARLYPQWKWNLRFVLNTLAAMHDMDKKSSHAIEIDVKNPAEVREIFDTTTYAGGSAVCNMAENYLSPEGFAKGVNQYLKRYEYANAETNDLWHELGEANGKPVDAIMSSYTRQPGYPVLVASERNLLLDGDRVITLKQKRFLFDGSED